MKIIFNRKYKLTSLLIILISTSVLLTTFILLFASYQFERKSLINTNLSFNYSKSEKISRSVGSLFKSMRISLQETSDFFSENPEMTDEEIQEQLELLRNNSSYFNSLSWIDETGRVRNIAPNSVGLKGEMITGVTKEVVDSKIPTLTKPYIAPTGRIIVLMSEPLFDSNGKYRGIIGGSIYLQEQNVLYQILGNDIIDQNGSYYYVVGPNGKLLFHPDISRIGEIVSGNIVVRKLLQGQSGKQQVINTKGVSMFSAYNFIPETGWGVVQQTPVSYINGLSKKHIQSLILTILLPFSILLLLSVSFARKLAKPFIELADCVNKFSSEKQIESPVHQTHWNREADLLTKSVIIAIDAINKNNKKLVEEAMTDSLTGLPNRRKLDEVLEGFVKDRHVFSLITLDIDHFKSINDTYGHQRGDEVLKYIAKFVQSVIRKNDVFFRYGGEEFVLILPDTKSEKAFQVAEAIRTTLEIKVSPIGKSITASFGIAEFPLHSDSVDELFLFADKALYQSKSNGRNQTTIWSL